MFDIVELVRFFRFTCEIRKMVRINGSSSNSSSNNNSNFLM